MFYAKVFTRFLSLRQRFFSSIPVCIPWPYILELTSYSKSKYLYYYFLGWTLCYLSIKSLIKLNLAQYFVTWNATNQSLVLAILPAGPDEQEDKDGQAYHDGDVDGEVIHEPHVGEYVAEVDGVRRHDKTRSEGGEMVGFTEGVGVVGFQNLEVEIHHWNWI